MASGRDQRNIFYRAKYLYRMKHTTQHNLHCMQVNARDSGQKIFFRCCLFFHTIMYTIRGKEREYIGKT